MLQSAHSGTLYLCVDSHYGMVWSAYSSSEGPAVLTSDGQLWLIISILFMQYELLRLHRRYYSFVGLSIHVGSKFILA